MRPRKPARTAIKALNDFFKITDEWGLNNRDIADANDMAKNCVSNYRIGHHGPTLQRFEEMVQSFGGRIEIVFDEDNPE